MNPDHIAFLRCPATGGPLSLEIAEELDGFVVRGCLRENKTGHEYAIVDYIPRFVSSENYALSFGVEWNIHHQTQYDDFSGFKASSERFFEETKWDRNLGGQAILEVGSGSGRFTREALSTSATVVSFDYSNAVEANIKNNGPHKDLLVVQADVFQMPFPRASFDKVFCFGMLQHTPDPEAAFHQSVEMVKPGGHIASDIYIKDWRHWFLQTKYWVRPFIDRSDPRALYERLRRYVDVMWPIARQLRKIPKLGYALNWRLLVADYSAALPGASEEVLREWAYLDTFDMLAPEYDIPQTVSTFRRWHLDAGLYDVDVHRGFNGVEGRGRKPVSRSTAAD